MRRLLGVVLVLAMCFALVLTGCAQTKPENTPAADASASESVQPSEAATESAAATESTGSESFTIAVVPKLVGITYFEAARAGVEQAGKDLGVNAVFTGPSEADAAEQVQMIQDLISQGVNAIAVSANDAASLTPVLTQAHDAGILVMDWDSPAERSVVDLSIKEIDYKTYAESTWDELVKAMGTDEGDYAILTSTLTAESCNEWIKFGLDYAKEKYPKLNLVTDPVTTNENVQEAYTKTLDLITTYPKLKGIIGFSSPAPIGAGQAVSEQSKQDTISVVGSALPNDAKTYVHEGAIDAVLLWEPAKLGYLTVYLADYMLKGNEVKDGDMEVPNVGTISISGKEVIMGPPTVFTKDNIDNFDF